jgi:hypothetical protein
MEKIFNITKGKTMNTQRKYVKQDIQDQLEDPQNLEDTHGSDLHHETCNTVLMFNSRKDAKNFLGSDTLEAMKKIKEWEEDNLGTLETDIFDELKVANMLCYILGQEILQESETLQDKWDECLTIEDLEKISKEI